MLVFPDIDNVEDSYYISIMKNNLTWAIVLVLLPVALLVVSIATQNHSTEKNTSLLLGLTALGLVNGLKTIYRHFKQLNKTPNSYEK